MADASQRPVRAPDLRKWKARGRKVTMLTAYDALTASLLERAGIDVILVGDSMGMVALGYETTVPVTINDVVHHCQAVTRAVSRPLVVGDMPFMSYQAGIDRAVGNAGRLIQEGGAAAVKLEGGKPSLALVERLTEIGIPVMGHIGLTPQSSHMMGGFKTQGRDEDTWALHEADAKAVAEAGAFSMVLEGMVEPLAARITGQVDIPTIGIGASADCDGQILVLEDMLGLNPRPPKFVKVYGDLLNQIESAVERYADDVKGRKFPTEDEVYR